MSSRILVDEINGKSSSEKFITSDKPFSGKVVHCWIHPTSNQSIPNNSSTVVAFQKVYVDTHNMADLDNNRIVIGTGLGGYYHVSAGFRANAWSAPRMSMQIHVNNATRAFREDSNGSSHTGEYPHTIIDTITHLSDGDAVTAKFYHNYGSSQTNYSLAGTNSESHAQSWLWLYRIGD